MNTPNKILVVDDDQVNLEFFQLMLSKLGFTIEVSSDGIEALEKLTKFQPDLILLDNIMPRMTGFDLTKKLKEDIKYKDIPLIMFSALDDIQDKITGFELGIDDYITKPFHFSEVLARINATLRNSQLFSQIALRESRLSLAEDMACDLKQLLSDFTANINELESAIALIMAGSEISGQAPLSQVVENIQEKTERIRKQAAGLEARIERTISDWESLKKDEIGLSTLEVQIRKILHQEQ